MIFRFVIFSVLQSKCHRKVYEQDFAQLKKKSENNVYKIVEGIIANNILVFPWDFSSFSEAAALLSHSQLQMKVQDKFQ